MIAWYTWPPLRYECGVIENLLLGLREVSLGAAHPQQVEMKHHSGLLEWPCIVSDQPFQCQWIKPIEGKIDKALILFLPTLIKKSSPSAVRGHIFSPDHRVADKEDRPLRQAGFQMTLEKPVILTGGIGYAVIHFRIKRFDRFPHRRE